VLLDAWHADREVFAIAEPGWKGGRISLGYATEKGVRESSMLTTLRASLYRRWNSDDANAGGTYIGMEGSAASLANIPLGLRVGVFTRIAGPTRAPRTLFSIDVPVGY
jgi:hypothetical protein